MLLIVLVMEGFKAVGEGLISLFKVGNACKNVSISHFLFIDVPINFIDNDTQPILHLRCIVLSLK